MRKLKANYGLDAPSAVKCLLFFGCGAFALTPFAFLVDDPFWQLCALLLGPTSSLIFFWISLSKVYSSKIKKPKLISKLIEELDLQPDQRLLDLGCGKGIFLIEAAKRLEPKNAYGVDIWDKYDHSDNSVGETLNNARKEGVEVCIQTADIRSLPFPDGSFDAVVSSFAIHSIQGECGRDKALFEMLRVLKPGGKFFLLDIHYGQKYADFLKDLEISCTKASFFPTIYILKGKKPKHSYIEPINHS